jgi:hypothetical protein
MAELIQEYATGMQTADHETFVVRTYADRRLDGTWIAWLEFEPVGGRGPILRTDRETRRRAKRWTSGRRGSKPHTWKAGSRAPGS